MWPPVDAHNSAITMGEDLSDMWPNRHVKFHAIAKAPAEKSVTVHTKK